MCRKWYAWGERGCEKERRAPLFCNEHGNTIIVTCLKKFFFCFLVFRFSINGERRFLACLNRSGIRLPYLTSSKLGQPIEPVVTFLSPTSIIIPPNPASPDTQSDTVSTTQGQSSFCSAPTVTTDQLQASPISTSVGDARSKIISSRSSRAQSKRKLRNLQRPAGKNYNSRDRLTVARQHKREHFARLARAVKCPRFNPHLRYRLGPEFFSWEILFWDTQRQEFTTQKTLLPSQRLVVPRL